LEGPAGCRAFLVRRNMRRAGVCWALALVYLLGACASPFAEAPTQSEEGGLPQDLGKSASSGPDRPLSAGGSKERGTRGHRDDPTHSSQASGENEGKRENEGDDVAPGADDFMVIGSFSDAAGDQAAGAPDYADVVGAAIGDDGDRARIIVEVAGALPTETARAEVEGLGVDLYRGSGDYQLFASGEPEGWFGYLYTPDGFVAYRGDLQLGTRTVTFTVPWDAIGGRGPGEFGLFLDWSGSGDRFSQDLAPQSGTVPFGGTP